MSKVLTGAFGGKVSPLLQDALDNAESYKLGLCQEAADDQ